MTVFYKKDLVNSPNRLDEEEAKHCFQVLRHQSGDQIMLFDGKGGKYRAVLTQVSKKFCEFDILSSEQIPEKPFSIHLAIAPTKNADRMEWMIEKLCEIGVDKVTLISTRHSERKKLRLDRLEKKAISAMKQSGNPFLLQLNELTDFQEFISGCTSQQKVIAHVDNAHRHLADVLEPKKSITILIGPEGDFSKEEVDMASQSGFMAVSLGNNTLRTETAGLVACCMVNFKNLF
ncbi:MAG: 16S rRNA (uracil(1498)-N(3))-methyltransferase [Ekhidna sp.]|uniref:16S rRNA (uracil(1498)-N(3))-methyltransferase n=1 Tax=Ekhidna sp. TaxID=2608089 RepID=UPI0032EFADCC